MNETIVCCSVLICPYIGDDGVCTNKKILIGNDGVCAGPLKDKKEKEK